MSLFFVALTVLAVGPRTPDADRPRLPPEAETAVVLPPQTRPRGERHRLEALRQYGQAVLCERRQRPLEALECLEAAARLDPDAAAPRKALIPIYLALERHAEAQALTRQVLERDPDDYETWYVHSRQLQSQGDAERARAALARAVACPGLKNDPEALAQASLELARMFEDRRDWAEAAATLDRAARALEQDQADGMPIELYESLGRVCAQAGRWDEAAAAYRKAREQAAEEGVLARHFDYELARVYSAQGKPAEALQELDAYLATQPPGTEPYEFKLRLLAQLGRGHEGLAALREATGRDPNNGALKLLLARRYVAERQPGAAKQLYVALAAESPSTEVYRGLFDLYRTTGRQAEALALLDRTIAAGTDRAGSTGDAAARLRARAMVAALREEPALAAELVPLALPALQPETRRFLAAAAAHSRQLAAAEELYRSCLDGGEPLPVQAAVYDGLLHVLWAAAKHEAVVEVCRRALADATPLHALPFHGNLARALVVLGKTKEALAEADQAVRLSDPGNRLAYRLLRVEVMTFARRYDQAEAACRELLREAAAPEEVRRVRAVLAGIHSTTHAYAQAEEQLRLILQSDPDDATANNDLGYILADQGKSLAEAERLIRKALALDRKRREGDGDAPDAAKAAFLDSLGWVLFRQGKPAEARRELERAAALPDGGADPVVWDHLGDVYLRLGETGQARAAWEKARDLFETEKRRRADDAYEKVKGKLRQLGDPSGSRWPVLGWFK
jgi:tetratricopeptide (TPR) repeat protein